MLYIKTYIDKSNIHGLGIFAGENVDEMVVIARDDTDLVVERNVIDDLPEDAMARRMFNHYGYIDKKDGKWHLSQGMEIFFNESNDPNCRSFHCDGRLVTETTRPVKKGEELTANYSDFEL